MMTIVLHILSCNYFIINHFKIFLKVTTAKSFKYKYRSRSYDFTGR